MQDKEVPERKDKEQEKRTTGQRMGMGVEAPMPPVDAAPTPADAVTEAKKATVVGNALYRQGKHAVSE